MDTLQDVFLHELADMLNAEKQLVKALPKLAKAAATDQLRDAFEAHLDETKNQVKRLEKVFETFGKSARGKACKAMQGLIEEGSEMIKEEEENVSRDAGLICAAQKVEHYEIATYGSLCAWAKELKNPAALKLLQANMSEEEAADKKLSQLAQSVVNPQSNNGHETAM